MVGTDAGTGAGGTGSTFAGMGGDGLGLELENELLAQLDVRSNVLKTQLEIRVCGINFFVVCFIQDDTSAEFRQD